MNQWFWSDGCLWWLGTQAPSTEALGEDMRLEELCFDDRSDASTLLGHLFADNREAELNRLLRDNLPGTEPQRLSAGERQRLLAEMVARHDIRVWRLERSHTIAVHGVDTRAAPPSPAGRPAGRPAKRPPVPAPPPAAAPAGGPVPPAKPGAVPVSPLTWYQFELVDELGDGLAGVEVELQTPAGAQRLLTNAVGAVRTSNVPPGRGSARVDRGSLVEALLERRDRPRRLSRPPKESAVFQLVTPLRTGKTFSLDHERPLRVMVVSRTDVIVAGADPRWPALEVAPGSQPACGYTAGETTVLRLCSRGSGEAALVEGRIDIAALPPLDSAEAIARAAATQARHVVRPGESLWAIAERLMGDPLRWPELRQANAALLKGRPENLIHPGDVLLIPVAPRLGLIPRPGPWPAGASASDRPTFLDTDVDGLHEALFDRGGERRFAELFSPLQRLASPPEPDLDPPLSAAAAAGVLASVVALELALPAELLQPQDIPTFDPVERAGPRR